MQNVGHGCGMLTLFFFQHTYAQKYTHIFYVPAYFHSILILLSTANRHGLMHVDIILLHIAYGYCKIVLFHCILILSCKIRVLAFFHCLLTFFLCTVYVEKIGLWISLKHIDKWSKWIILMCIQDSFNFLNCLLKQKHRELFSSDVIHNDHHRVFRRGPFNIKEYIRY